MDLAGAPLAGRYAVNDLLGSGGAADVHRATDLVLDREVAVKLLRVAADDEVARARFTSEARTLAALNHPGLVTVLDAGTHGEQPYLVMELVDGPTLAQQLRTNGPMEADRVEEIGAQLAEALAYAHARGVVHRDVKPGNVLLRTDGRAVITDFGIARLVDDAVHHTSTGEVIGSPAYLAPEQVTGTAVASAADVYALGLVLLEACTGERSYTGPPIEAAVARLSSPPAFPLSMDASLRALLTSMTALDPADRPTAAAVAATLQGGTRVLPVVAANPPANRRRLVALVGTAAAGVLAVTLAVALSGGTDPVQAGAEPTPVATPSRAPSTAPTGNPTSAPVSRTPVRAVAQTREPAKPPAAKKAKPGKPEKAKKPKTKGKAKPR